MSELDGLAKEVGGKKKKGGDMKGAVEGTEAIRQWVSIEICVQRALDVVKILDDVANFCTFGSFNFK